MGDCYLRVRQFAYFNFILGIKKPDQGDLVGIKCLLCKASAQGGKSGEVTKKQSIPLHAYYD